MKKIISLFMCMAMVLSLAVGCSSNKTEKVESSKSEVSTTTEVSNTTKASLEKVNLKIMSGADTANVPKTEEVLAAICEATKDQLNLGTITIVNIPWAECAEKIKLNAAGGEKFDIFHSFAGEFAGNVTRKQGIELNALLDNYGQDIKNMISSADFMDLTVDSKIYGIPAIYPSTDNTSDGVIIRKDLRLKYNIPEINSVDTFEQYLDAIVKNEKGMTPIYGRGGRFRIMGLNGDLDSYWEFGTDAGPVIKVKATPGAESLKVVSVFEVDELLWNWTKKAVDKGWLSKDTLTTKDDLPLFLAGKCAVLNYDIWNLNSLPVQLKQNIPGAEMEYVRIFKDRQVVKNAMVNNYAMISATSDNPERAMMFLNWLRQSQENYEFYTLGRKGIDWEPVGDSEFKYLETDASKIYRPTPWWTKSMQYDRFEVGANPEFLKEYKKATATKYENSPLMGFTVDTKNIIKEVAQCNVVTLEKIYPLNAGITSGEKAIKEANDAMNAAGLQKIIDEVQKQVDAHLAKNKK